MGKTWPFCAAAALTFVSAPVAAQPISAEEAAAMRAQVEALRAQVAALEARLNAASPASAPVASPAPLPTPPAAPATEITWRGAPELRNPSGWSFKPRGRLQIDVGGVDAPNNIGDRGLGYASEIRRVQLGAEGAMPGGFGYRVEVELQDNSVTANDIFVTYTDGALQIMAGNHKPFPAMEEATSDVFTSFTERAAFTQAFGFERRLGVSASWTRGIATVQGGLFADDISALTIASNNSWSLDGRLVLAPRIGATQLHFGASAHSRDFNDAASTARYRTRPFVHTTDTRLVDTNAFTASGESNFGAEFAAINGRFHAAGEAAWMRARRPALADPIFDGGYVELGAFLTNDTRNYRKGGFDRVSPRRGLHNGGMGAVELNLRYDWLDLSDASAGIIGGEQDIYGGSLTWIATPYVRFIASYGHIALTDARIAAGMDRDYSADAVALRAQMDF